MTFRPTSLTFNGSTWQGAQPYNAADIPVPSYMTASGVDRTVLEQQFAYEWYDSSSQYNLNHNPPFTTGAAGRLLPDGGPPKRILRGFIRRAEYDVSDKKSTARLYFMFNPENITRDYVSYLDQGALDPFNTVFQSGNLVPPPSFMDFSFSLFFDRQEEAAADGNHPGVFVDYEYFDLVVRNVVPSYDPNTTSSGGSDLPDNGVMMVNPRDITVVFSPNITVQGRPSNARVQFLKFTHRMIPIRMQVDLTMRVTYFGPMKDMVEYSAEQAKTADTVPWTATTESPFTALTNDQIYQNSQLFLESMKGGNLLTEDQIKEAIQALIDGKKIPDDISNSINNGINANQPYNESIADYAFKQMTEVATIYDSNDRANLWTHADCSSWMWAVFATHPSHPNLKMGGDWKNTFEDGVYHHKTIPDTNAMIGWMDDGTTPAVKIFSERWLTQSTRIKAISPQLPLVMKGDLLLRKAAVRNKDDKGHISIVYANNTGTSIETVDIGTPGKRASHNTLPYAYVASNYTDCWRPSLGTPDTPLARSGGN